MRGATITPKRVTKVFKFQSTLPMRGATTGVLDYINNNLISIHAPHAGSDSALLASPPPAWISIHAPHAGSDAERNRQTASERIFQSTLPMRGATPSRKEIPYWHLTFQSTLPMRGATSYHRTNLTIFIISIHAPHAGSDGAAMSKGFVIRMISIHAPHAGSDYLTPVQFFTYMISIHAPHAGSDDVKDVGIAYKQFQSTLPMRGATIFEAIVASGLFTFQSTLPMRGATTRLCGAWTDT